MVTPRLSTCVVLAAIEVDLKALRTDVKALDVETNWCRSKVGVIAEDLASLGPCTTAQLMMIADDMRDFRDKTYQQLQQLPEKVSTTGHLTKMATDMTEFREGTNRQFLQLAELLPTREQVARMLDQVETKIGKYCIQCRIIEG